MKIRCYNVTVAVALQILYSRCRPLKQVQYLDLALLKSNNILATYCSSRRLGKPGFVMSAFGFPAEPIPLNGLIGAVIAAVMSSAVYLLVRVLKGWVDLRVADGVMGIEWN